MCIFISFISLCTLISCEFTDIYLCLVCQVSCVSLRKIIFFFCLFQMERNSRWTQNPFLALNVLIHGHNLESCFVYAQNPNGCVKKSPKTTNIIPTNRSNQIWVEIVNRKKVKQDYLTYIFPPSSTNSGCLQTNRSIRYIDWRGLCVVHAHSLAFIAHRTSYIINSVKLYCRPLDSCLWWNLLTFVSFSVARISRTYRCQPNSKRAFHKSHFFSQNKNCQAERIPEKSHILSYGYGQAYNILNFHKFPALCFNIVILQNLRDFAMQSIHRFYLWAEGKLTSRTICAAHR